MGAAAEKPAKIDSFRHFWPRLPNGVANCSGTCWQIWLKFYVVNGLGYGYERFEFRWGAMRYVRAVAEKPTTIDCFSVFGLS